MQEEWARIFGAQEAEGWEISCGWKWLFTVQKLQHPAESSSLPWRAFLEAILGDVNVPQTVPDLLGFMIPKVRLRKQAACMHAVRM